MYRVDVMYWNIELQKFSSQLSGGTTTHMLFNFEEFFYCWRKRYWFQKTYIFSHKLFMFSKFGISWSNSPERKCCWEISRKLFRYLKIMFIMFLSCFNCLFLFIFFWSLIITTRHDEFKLLKSKAVIWNVTGYFRTYMKFMN